MRKRHWFWVLPLLAIIGLLFLDAHVEGVAKAYLFDDLNLLPKRPVALVLGTSKYLRGGRINLYYSARIRAAAELFHAGKAEVLLVSGDNRTREYDEPSTMKADLIAAGVPEDSIVCDYAGLRTLDSVVRAEAIFGQRSYTVVSQRFHCQRALYIGLHRQQEIQAYCADAVVGPLSWKVRLREVFARCIAVLDVHLLHTQPRHLGPAQPLSH